MRESTYNAKFIRYDNKVEIIRYREPKFKVFGNGYKKSYPLRHDKTEPDEELQKLQQMYRIKRKIKYYLSVNYFDLFWTLTFNDELVNAKNYDYARKKIQAWLKYQREKYGKFSFVFVPELHKSKRIHFHGVTGYLSPPLVEARSKKTNRLIKKKGKQVYNAENYKLGFSTITYIESPERVSSYLTKYITKELIDTPSGYHQPKYFVSRGLKLPEISYKQIDDDYFGAFEASFVTGTLGDKNKFEADISIYHIVIDENGEMKQHDIQQIVKIK